MQRENIDGLIKFYSVAAALFAVIVMVYGVALAAGLMGTDLLDAFLGLAFLIVAFFLFIVARGLWLRALWARYSGVALAAVLIIYSIFNFTPEKILIIIIAGSALYILYKEY